jgi:hypothetical protein
MRTLLAALALVAAAPAVAGTHVGTFENDGAYTKAPIAGLYSAAADGAVIVASLKPAAAPFPATAEHVRNEAAPGSDVMVAFTNPASNWADLSINGVAVGVIGPYNTVRLSGVPTGAYVFTLTFASGYTRTLVVE